LTITKKKMAETRDAMAIQGGLGEQERRLESLRRETRRLLLKYSLLILLLSGALLAFCIVLTTRQHGVNTRGKIILWLLIGAPSMICMLFSIAILVGRGLIWCIDRAKTARVTDLPDAQQSV
jgi:lysylphosphatidylglycerol synthetase-like protein (DUF2156 family)